jgi:hypothetical protein
MMKCVHTPIRVMQGLTLDDETCAYTNTCCDVILILDDEMKCVLSPILVM